MNKQKGNALLIVVLIVAVFVLGYWSYLRKGNNEQPQTIKVESESIKTQGDLTAASNELDGQDLDSMDSDLDQLSVDSLNF